MGFFDFASFGSDVGKSVIDTGLGYFSAKQQNDMAQENARDAERFTAGQSAQQIAFQERMSNTAHQREVADLKAAGLNPLLSLNSGASTPAGGMGSGVNAPVVAQIGAGVGSAREGMRLRAELRTMAAQAKKAEAEGDLAGMERDYAKNDRDAYFMSKFGVGTTSAASLVSNARANARKLDVWHKGTPVGGMSPGMSWMMEKIMLNRMNSALAARKKSN